MNNLQDTLFNLAKRRLLFHSETDFQHELAWQFKLDNPQLEIRLEKPITSIYVDLVVIDDIKKIGIELKYKTSQLAYLDTKTNDLFQLKEHAALDLGRYDFLKDISRLEILKSDGIIETGYCIFLTNCPYYWTKLNYNYIIPPNDINFRLEDGQCIKGKIQWTKETKESTVGKTRIAGISIRNEYFMKWYDYSNLNIKYGLFRYLLVEI